MGILDADGPNSPKESFNAYKREEFKAQREHEIKKRRAEMLKKMRANRLKREKERGWVSKEIRIHTRLQAMKAAKDQVLQHRHFMAAEYYLRGKSKYEAMKLAGYSDSTAMKAAFLVFDRPDVLRYIKTRQEKMRDNQRSMVKRIQEELSRIAFFNIGKLVRVDESTGDFIYDFTDASMEDFAALGEVTVEKITEGRGLNRQDVKRIRVKPHSKMDALNTLSRIYGLMQDNLNITTEDGGSIEERLARGRKRLKKDDSDIIEGSFQEVSGEE